MCDARALLDCTLTIIEPTVDYGKPVLWVVSHVRKTSLVVQETPAPARQRTRRKPAEVSPSRRERPLPAGKLQPMQLLNATFSGFRNKGDNNFLVSKLTKVTVT